MSFSTLRRDWLRQPVRESLAGAVATVALIPEVIAFSFAAGLTIVGVVTCPNPVAGLHAAESLAWIAIGLVLLLQGCDPLASAPAESPAGLARSQREVDELLASHRVRPVAALGHALDPQCMHAVAVEWTPEAAEGAVLRELRRGFYQGTELLRAADVIVNKKGPAA